MRLFIAINFPKSIKENILKIQDELRQFSTRGNFSRPENLHLTLVFLGEVPSSKIDVIKNVMNSVKVSPFTLCFEGSGKFGNTHWIGIKKCAPLLSLQRSLTDGLKKSGFKIESRSFKPHITIAREVELGQKHTCGFEPFCTEVNSFVLMKSERISGKLTYTEVYEKNL